MTPQFYVKKEILKDAKKFAEEWGEDFNMPQDSELEEFYDDNQYEIDSIIDATNEFRGSGENTDLKAPSSRHYECNRVARKVDDEKWISWIYWYGGGKHGNPEEIEWVEDVTFVSCIEEEKTVIVRTFSEDTPNE